MELSARVFYWGLVVFGIGGLGLLVGWIWGASYAVCAMEAASDAVPMAQPRPLPSVKRFLPDEKLPASHAEQVAQREKHLQAVMAKPLREEATS